MKIYNITEPIIFEVTTQEDFVDYSMNYAYSNTSGEKDLFVGRAYRKPGASKIQFRLNDLIRPLFSSEFPATDSKYCKVSTVKNYVLVNITVKTKMNVELINSYFGCFNWLKGYDDYYTMGFLDSTNPLVHPRITNNYDFTYGGYTLYTDFIEERINLYYFSVTNNVGRFGISYKPIIMAKIYRNNVLEKTVEVGRALEDGMHFAFIFNLHDMYSGLEFGDDELDGLTMIELETDTGMPILKINCTQDERYNCDTNRLVLEYLNKEQCVQGIQCSGLKRDSKIYSNKYIYNVDNERVPYTVKQTEKMEVNTGWITEKQMNDMREVFTSPIVHLYNKNTDKHYKCELGEKTWTESVYKADKKLFNQTFNLTIIKEEEIYV